jgi:long-chain acyl-CoA synthetase
VSDWARTHNVPYTGFNSLVRSPEVIGLIKQAITAANAELSRVEQIKDFRILPKMLDPSEENEPVTPTRKIKRDLMYQRFKGLVEEMYDDREQRLITQGAGTIVAAS